VLFSARADLRALTSRLQQRASPAPAAVAVAARARRAVTPPLGELEQSIAEPVRAATSLQAASLHDQLRAAYLGTGARASAGTGAAAQRVGGLGR